MTNTFCIPRIRIRAQVALAGRRVREVSLFLGEHAQRHGGHERPSDVLASSRGFLPALDGDALVFINLEQVTMVTVAAELEYTADEMALLEAACVQDTSRRIGVMLEDGTALSGEVAYVMPEGQRRVQDFLNCTERFFRLRDGDHARLVNKSRVLWVRQD